MNVDTTTTALLVGFALGAVSALGFGAAVLFMLGALRRKSPPVPFRPNPHPDPHRPPDTYFMGQDNKVREDPGDGKTVRTQWGTH